MVANEADGLKRELAAAVSKKASPALQQAIRAALPLASHFVGRNVREGLREADTARKAKPTPASTGRTRRASKR